MGINLDVGNIKHSQDRHVRDRETVGIIVNSKSGYDYPQLVGSYEDFRSIFTSDPQYSYLYETDFNIAPVRLSSGEEYASLTFTSNPKIPSYFTSNFKIKGSILGLPSAELVNSSTYTNHYVIEIPKSINGNGYFSLPIFDRDHYGNQVFYLSSLGKKWNELASIFGVRLLNTQFIPTSQGMNNLRSSIDVEDTLRNMVVNDERTRTIRSDYKFQVLEFVDEHGTRTNTKFIIWTTKPVSYLSPNPRGNVVKVSRSPIIENAIYEKFASDDRIFSVRSKVPGTYGNRISVQFTARSVNRIPQGSLIVYFDGVQVESYSFEGDIFDLYFNVNTNSKYIVCLSLWDSDNQIIINSPNPIQIYANLGGVYKDDVLTDETYVNSVKKLVESDGVDLILYDQKVNKWILDEIIKLDLQYPMVIQLNEKPDFDLTPYKDRFFFTYGSVITPSGLTFPTSYIFLKLFKNKLVGDVSGQYRVTDPIDLPGSNQIKYDGLKYYVDFIPHDLVREVTRCRIHRRFRRLVDYLGTSLDDIRSQVRNIISDLKSDIPILESIYLDSFKVKGNELEVKIKYNFPKLRVEKFTLNINLNILN